MCYTVRVKARNVLHGASECAGCVSAHEKMNEMSPKAKKGYTYHLTLGGGGGWTGGRNSEYCFYFFIVL